MIQNIENICSINPENLGVATPTKHIFEYIDIS